MLDTYRSVHPRELLELPDFTSPILTDPETGELQSVFSPGPDEPVPPADILAEVFPPAGEPGLTVPDEIDAVRALAGSISAFYDRTEPQFIRNRLDVYAAAVQRKEDKLDPPVNRYLRLFREEMNVELRDEDGFYGLMSKFFEKSPNHAKPTAELYQELAEAFYKDPKTLGLFYLFTGSAATKDNRYIRKDWYYDRVHLLYPPLGESVREGMLAEPEESGSAWFTDAIWRTEELFEEIAADYPDMTDDSSGKLGVYTVLEALAQASFATEPNGETDMHRYHYAALEAVLNEVEASADTPKRHQAARRFALDVSRNVGARLLEQQVVRLEAPRDVYIARKAALPILKIAMRKEDGYHTDYASFEALFYEQIGVDKAEYPVFSMAFPNSNTVIRLGSSESHAEAPRRTDTR